MGRKKIPPPSEACQSVDCDKPRWRELPYFHGARVSFCLACYKRARRTGNARNRARRPKNLHVNYEGVAQMLEDGLAGREIAAKLDVPTKRVYEIMRELKAK